MNICRDQSARMKRTDLHVGHIVMTRLLHVGQLQLLRDLTHGLSQQHKVDPGQLALFLFGHISCQNVIQACQKNKVKVSAGTYTHRDKATCTPPLPPTGSQTHFTGHLALHYTEDCSPKSPPSQRHSQN